MAETDTIRSGFAVDGMFCGGCAATVERTLTRVPGVISASVSFVSDAALVQHEAGVRRADLAAAIRRLGYGVRPLDEDAADGSSARDAFQRRHHIRLAVAICFGMWTMLASFLSYLGQWPTEDMAWIAALVGGVLAMPVVLYSGSAFYSLGWRSLRAGAPGMEALISLAVIAAVTVSVVNLVRGVTYVYFDAAVMLITFQLIARLTDFSVRRTAGDAVRRLLQLAPKQARRVVGGDHETVHPRALETGDTIEVRSGERISADGRVASGHCRIDSSVVTGEALPRTVKIDAEVSAGEMVIDGVLRIAVEAPGGKRRIDALATEVRRLIVGKGALARLADHVARWLLPVILLAAVAAFLLAVATGAGWQDGISRALAVMIVTCPCALSLAVPLVLTTAASTGARHGIILRDPGALEKASRIDTIVFDKTGTLTSGHPAVVAVHATSATSRAEMLRTAARAEAGSLHPLACAIRTAAEHDIPVESGAAVQEIAGSGIEMTTVDGQVLRVGSAAWFRACGLEPLPCHIMCHAGSRVEVAVNDTVLGAIELADTLRPEAADIIARLQRQGRAVVLASGDGEATVRGIAEALGIDWHAAMRPDQKLALIEQYQAGGRHVAFVGDGLNDGPALAAADLGIAVGDANDLARSAAAMGLLANGVTPVANALTLSRRAGRILRQNLAWALLYNGILLPLAIAGFVDPLFAAVAMAASSLSVSLNSVRAGWLPHAQTDAQPADGCADSDTPVSLYASTHA